MHPHTDVPCDPLRLVSLVRARSYGRVRDLRLEVRGAGLILCGRTTSYYEALSF